MLKLSPKCFGPYTILARVGEVAYRLQLPTGVKVHLVFHVSLLKKTVGHNTATSSVLPPMEEESKGVVEPQAIVDRRVIHQGMTPYYASFGKVVALTTGSTNLGVFPGCAEALPSSYQPPLNWTRILSWGGGICYDLGVEV